MLLACWVVARKELVFVSVDKCVVVKARSDAESIELLKLGLVDGAGVWRQRTDPTEVVVPSAVGAQDWSFVSSAPILQVTNIAVFGVGELVAIDERKRQLLWMEASTDEFSSI